MKPLFITAHYDDLEICAGGTAARYGGTSVVLSPKTEKGTEAEADAAARILGIQRIEMGHYVGSRKRVYELDLLAEYHDVIIASSPWDSHPEHRAAADIARQVARRGKTLWFMDHAIPGGYASQALRPNHFVALGERMEKYDALDCYEVLTQRQVRTVMYRDRYYGHIHGEAAAEGFVVANSIQ